MRKEGERGLTSIEDCVHSTNQRHNDKWYLQKAESI